MTAVTALLGHRQKNVVTRALEFFEGVEFRAVARVIFSIEEKGRDFDLMHLAHSLRCIVVLIQTMCSLITEEGYNGVLVHVHHTEAVFMK
jgi:hypothetical protein